MTLESSANERGSDAVQQAQGNKEGPVDAAYSPADGDNYLQNPDYSGGL